MKTIITELTDLIKLNIPEFRAVGAWNNQLQAMSDGVGYEVPMPALFIEIASPSNIEQLGAGYQLYEVDVILHICHANYNNTGDLIDSDLMIFDLKQQVFELIQRKELTLCSELVRVSESTDTNHDTVIDYVQIYKTTYLDATAKRYEKLYTTLPTGTNIQVNE